MSELSFRQLLSCARSLKEFSFTSPGHDSFYSSECKYAVSACLGLPLTGQITPRCVSYFRLHRCAQKWETSIVLSQGKRKVGINTTERNEDSGTVSNMFGCLFKDSLTQSPGKQVTTTTTSVMTDYRSAFFYL